MRGPFHSSGNARGHGRGPAIERPIAAGLKLDAAHTEQIERSHQRCSALGLSRIGAPDHAGIARPDLRQLRERNLRLHLHAAPVMELLHEQIVNTHSMVALTDATGTILLSIGDDDFLDRAARVALAPGANWSEAAKGTNAVGTALVSELPTLVHADEHYLHANHFLTCSAAPIFDPRGHILGVLDVSGDHRSYHQHTMALVKMSVRMIENHWLGDDCRQGLRLHFHRRPGFIGTLMEGILAVDAGGRIVGANRGAMEQLALPGAALRQHTLKSLFGIDVDALVDRFRSPLAAPLPVHTADGSPYHLHARFNGPQWAPLVEAVPAARAATEPAAALAAPAPATPAPVAPAQAVEAAPAPASCLAALRTGDALFDRLAERLHRVRDAGIGVLLAGEHGCGKGTLARALHQDSARADQAFVALDCAALAPEGLATGLARARAGTLFLDNVDALPPAAQLQLLQALQAPPLPAIVCGSRLALAEAVRRRRFREDLYYRLDGLALQVPALRERSDLPALAQALLAQWRPVHPPRLAPEALAALRRHRWPGNLRELKTMLRTALALAGDADTIGLDHLPDALVRGNDAAPPALPDSALPGASLQAQELEAMRRAVDAASGNLSAAARALGISRNTLYRKLRWRR